MGAEAKLTKAVRDWLREQDDVWCVKIHGGPMQQAGIPDLILCVRGRFVAIEMKAPHGPRSKKDPWAECTALQRSTLLAIADAEGVAAACDTLEQVQTIVGFVRKLASGEAPGFFRPEGLVG